MRQSLSLLVLTMLLPICISAAQFETFLKSFFADSTFQVNHIQFPLMGAISFISADDNLPVKTDTTFATSIGDWDYMSYGYGRPNVKFTVSKDIPKQLRSRRDLTYINPRIKKEDVGTRLHP